MAALALVLLALVSPAVVSAGAEPRDADTNSVIYNGAYSKAEWLGKIQNGDTKHTAANIQQVTFNEGRGITQANFMSADTVDGVAFKDGHVEVGGKTVATGGRSVGRNFMTGAVKSGSLWETPNSTSFVANSIPAFVNMEGGKFHYAVIKSCGNPMTAKAVVTATPTPTPTATPSPTPKAEVQSFECAAIAVTHPDAADKRTFRFTVTPQVENTKVTGYRFNVHQQGTDSATDVKDTPADANFADYTLGAGTWEITAQVKTAEGMTEINKKCSVVVTVTEEKPAPTPTPTPAPTGEVLGASLPVTGPESLLGGVAGLTAMGYAARGYLRSRKSLMDTLRSKGRPNDNQE